MKCLLYYAIFLNKGMYLKEGVLFNILRINSLLFFSHFEIENNCLKNANNGFLSSIRKNKFDSFGLKILFIKKKF